MSKPNVHGRRWLVWLGALFAVEQTVLLTWGLTKNMALLPWWIFAAGCAVAAFWLYMLAIAFVSPCPWAQWRGWNRLAHSNARTANWLVGVCNAAGVRFSENEHEYRAILPGEE